MVVGDVGHQSYSQERVRGREGEGERGGEKMEGREGERGGGEEGGWEE